MMLVGYTLVYAAVAARGRFVLNPWAALLADAYTTSGTAPGTTTPTTPTGKQHPGTRQSKPQAPIAPAAVNPSGGTPVPGNPFDRINQAVSNAAKTATKAVIHWIGGLIP